MSHRENTARHAPQDVSGSVASDAALSHGRTQALAGSSFLQVCGRSWHEIDRGAPDYDETCTLLPAPTHDDARFLCETWRRASVRGGFRIGRELPSRALAPLLPHLVLYEPVRSGADFRVRVAGAALLRRFGYDITGRVLSAVVEHAVFERQRRDLLALIRLHWPCAFDVQIVANRALALHFEIAALPVLAPDGITPWVLSGIFYHDWPANTGRPGQRTQPMYAMAVR